MWHDVSFIQHNVRSFYQVPVYTVVVHMYYSSRHSSPPEKNVGMFLSMQ